MNRTVRECVLVGLSAVGVSLVGFSCGSSPPKPRPAAPVAPASVREREEAPPSQRAAPPLLTKTDAPDSVPAPGEKAVLRSQAVIPDLALLRSADNTRLGLTLLDGREVTLLRDREERSQDGLLWFGHIEGELENSVVLSLVRDSLVGNISSPRGKGHEIRDAGHGVHWLREIDPSLYPMDCRQRDLLVTPRPSILFALANCDPLTDIDVMVVYTQAAKDAAGGPDAIEALIYLAFAEMNQSFINSQVDDLHMRLVHIEQVTYSETNDIVQTLTALLDPGDGQMDNVQALRDKYAADIVVLLSEDDSGLQGQAGRPDLHDFNPDLAYAVVQRACAVGEATYTFAHEVGHVMGADHDCNSPYDTEALVAGPVDYNHGFKYSAGVDAWRTIMALPAPRVSYWSNPDVLYPGDNQPMGTLDGTCPSDNHLVLQKNALTVANFRCSSPGVNNVWMRDAWSDTGEEPFVPAAGEHVYKSPYIWVRNERDTNLVHQHQHENPEFGSSNWVYVKLHNGSNDVASGDLELYWAEQGTASSWPSGWTMWKSVPVTGFAAHSTRVVEAEWTNLPGTGAYCLAAAWKSPADPMKTPSPPTTSIFAHVELNNNLIWKNVTIVDLVGPNMSAVYSIVVQADPGDDDRRDDNDRDRPASISVKPPGGDPRRSFIGVGQIVVRLDDVLMAAWTRGGRRSRGLKADRNELVLIDPSGAVLENLVLSQGVEGRMSLTFNRLPTTPQGDFTIDVVQTEKDREVGGVSFEIRTVKPRTGR